jgi:hypothetical protein
MELQLGPVTHIGLPSPACCAGGHVVLASKSGPVEIDGYGPIPPGAIRVMVSDGKRWRRSRRRELLARFERFCRRWFWNF